MVWFYANNLVFVFVDGALLAFVVLRLLTPPRQADEHDRRIRYSLFLMSVALSFLVLLHLIPLAFTLSIAWGGGSLLRWSRQFYPLAGMLFYLGFGAFLAAAIGQLFKSAPAKQTTEPLSNRGPVSVDASPAPPPRQQTDWGYLGKQVKLVLFRGIGFALLLGAAPLAFVQGVPGVGVMALATAVGCLWLGFHHSSPLAIKYASLADEESD